MSYDVWPPDGAGYDDIPPVDWCNPPPWLGAGCLDKPLSQLTLADPEVWMPIEAHLGRYEVSSHGRVQSLINGARALRPQPSTRYLQVQLTKGRPTKVHALVADAFIGVRPQGMFVLHADDDGHHNAPTNLRYGTRRENTDDARRNRRYPRGRNPTGDDLPTEHASAIRALKGIVAGNRLARVFGRSPGVISQIGTRQIWTHAPDMELTDALAIYRELDRRRSAA